MNTVATLAVCAPLLCAQLPTVHAPAGARGYTLLSPLRSTSTLLIDAAGRVVHEWRSDRPPGCAARLLPDGSVVRAERDLELDLERGRLGGGGAGGRLKRIAWDGELLWQMDLASEGLRPHHDFALLPDGNLLVVAWEMRTREQALSAGRDPAGVDEGGLWPDCVLELRPIPPDAAEVVWEWHAWDHLVQDRDPAAPNHGVVAERPERIDLNADLRLRTAEARGAQPADDALERAMRAIGYAHDGGGEAAEAPPRRDPDWLHTNSIDHDPQRELILLSVRELSELWVLDHSTTTAEAAGSSGGRYGRGGDLLYRWGNPLCHGAGELAERRLFLQHDATWVRPPGSDELRVLLFNNGRGRPAGDFSTVEELRLPFDPARGFVAAPGRPFGRAVPCWTYGDDVAERFYCAFLSGAQRLPSGSTLICMGTLGRLIEVTAGGEVVWEFRGEDQVERVPPAARVQNDLFRATRVPADHPALVGRDLGPG